MTLSEGSLKVTIGEQMIGQERFDLSKGLEEEQSKFWEVLLGTKARSKGSSK